MNQSTVQIWELHKLFSLSAFGWNNNLLEPKAGEETELIFFYDLSSRPLKTIIDVVSAFRSAVHSVTEEKEGSTRFKVQGGAAFNAIVRLCIVDLIPAFKHFLKVPAGEKVNVDRCKSWVKIRLTVKSYLADVIRVSFFTYQPHFLYLSQFY